MTTSLLISSFLIAPLFGGPSSGRPKECSLFFGGTALPLLLAPSHGGEGEVFPLP